MNDDITLFEHEKVIFEKRDVEKLSEYERQSIRELNRTAFTTSKDHDTGFITLYDKSIKASSYVGVIFTGRRSIQVLPKILSHKADSKDLGKEEVRELMRGFYRLLIYTGKLSKDVGSAQMHAVPHIFEWIVLSFSAKLHELVRQNLRKNYLNCRRNTRFLRGKLLIGEQIKRNYIHKERFYCEYDIFTEDILLNRILKCTSYLLYNITRNTRAKNNLWWILFLMDRVRLTNILPHHFERLRLTRLGEGYRDIIALCEVFLRHSTVDITRGGVPAFSYMFDMNDLFEEFCYRFIRRNKGDILPDELAGSNVVHHRCHRKLIEPDNGKGKFVLETDISLEKREKEPEVIIDTKYKELDKDSRNCGISQDDLYQMYAYLKKYGCSEGILLYPLYQDGFDISDSKDEYYDMRYDDDTHLHIRQVDLSPLSPDTDDNDKDWKTEIIKSFRGVFEGIITEGSS